jgi:hypothetical protein
MSAPQDQVNIEVTVGKSPQKVAKIASGHIFSIDDLAKKGLL